MKVLLVSESPVAGTVVKFSKALDSSPGFSSEYFILRGYKNNSFEIPGGVMGVFENWPEILQNKLAYTDFIILHNVADQNLIDLIMANRRVGSLVAYHYHSPPFEGPLFTYEVIRNNKFDLIFCVAQGHSRFTKNSINIANIISDVNFVERVKRRNALFLGHLRSTDLRWSKKVPKNYASFLSEHLKENSVKVFDTSKAYGSDVVNSQAFLNGMQGFSYVVDDVCSGLFHQTSLEALKCGAISFSAADEVSISSFCEAAECPPPPFDLVSRPEEVVERVVFYSRAKAARDVSIEKNLRYANEYLGQSRLEKIFVDKIKFAIK